MVAVENRFAKEGRKTALGLMGTGQLSLTKAIVLVDAEVNPRDRAAVFGAIAMHFDPAEDFLLLPGVPLDTLDFTSFTMNLGSKMVIDAQSKPERSRPAPGSSAAAGAAGGAGPGGAPGLPAAAGLAAALLPDPRAFEGGIAAHRLAWGGMLVVQVAADGRGTIERLVARPEYAHVKLIVAVSPDVPLEDDELVLWGIFTRFDCARDIVPARTESRGAWLTCKGPLGIDATWKSGYPPPVDNLPEVITRVSEWWGKA